jgi:hypothetical protein
MARLFVAATALLVLLSGGAYAAAHPPTYESSASVALVPSRRAPHDLQGFLGGDTIATTAITYIELLASPATLAETGFRGVHVSVEDEPDTSAFASGTPTRAIDVTTRSRQRRLVRPGLSALIAAARGRERTLDDLWDITTISSPSAPQAIGPTRGRIVGASALLAMLAALALSTLLRYFGPARRPSRV